MSLLLSIIIVSFRRMDDLEKCLNSVETRISEKETVEIIVVDNAGSEQCEALSSKYGARYVKSPNNVGVAGGRNLGIAAARGAYLFFIDDDAEIATPDFDRLIREAFNDNIGILAFRVLNYYSNSPNPGELPFRYRNESQLMNSRFVSYFVGTGFALKRTAIQDTGFFFEDYFYAVEELDYSYRALSRNWRIYYLADVLVMHKKSPIRITGKKQYYYQMRNRCIISAKFFPFPYYLTYIAYWALTLFILSFRDNAVRELGDGILKGIGCFLRYRRTANIVDSKTIDYIKNNEGRIWY